MLSLCVLLVILIGGCAGTEYYVTAGSGCPDHTECHSLSYYVNNTAAYFTSNTIFYFLEGIHELLQDVQIVGAINLTLQGHTLSGASIHCTGSNGLNFFGGADLKLSQLTVASCKRVGFFYSKDILISDFSILKSKEYGFYFANAFDVRMESCDFTNTVNNTVFHFDPPTNCSPSLERFGVTLSGLNITAGGHAASFFLHQGASYGVNVVIQNSTINSHSHLPGIEFSVYNESIHSIVLDGISSTSRNGLVLRGLVNYTQAKWCYTNNLNKTLVPLRISNSNFHHRGSETDSAIMLNIAYPIYSCDQTIVISSCNFSKIFMNSAKVVFNNVIVANSQSSGVVAYNSQILMNGTLNVIANNSAFNGGGMSMYGGSSIVLYPPVAMEFVNNTADNKGGAVYWEGNPYYPFTVYCANLITIATYNVTTSQHVRLTFEGNTAEVAGDDIYGLPTVLCDTFVYSEIIKFNRFPTVSGDPIGVCSCQENGTLDCNTSYIELLKYPGQSASMLVVMVADSLNTMYVPTPSITDGALDITVNSELHSLKTLKSQCTEWKYDIITNSTHLPELTDILLQVYNPSGRSNNESVFSNEIQLSITVGKCPLGFELVDGVCKCSRYIAEKVVANCWITNSSFERQGKYWIGEYYISSGDNNDTDDVNSSCLIAVECPLDYCVSASVNFTVNDTDSQCRYNRAGVLCGQCSEGYSLVLGSNKCKVCSNGYIALVIPFALFGVALVVILILLNLTVAVGTINGLIFYANIVKLYESSFFPDGPIPFLSQFISWLNLDFGIETCFYSGMDSYIKVWLQYVFPFYIWCLIACIIWLCRHSGRVSRLMGNNTVPVLATLLLLAYTKLFRTIIGALHRIELNVNCQDMEDDVAQTVWYSDPNVLYRNTQHLGLVFVSCFILVFFGLPYTMFHLFTAQIERHCFHRMRCGSLLWLKPVIDAYGSPYKDGYQFWTGILLLARIILLIVISFTDFQIGLAILATVLIIIFTCAYSLGGVYKKRWLNFLEAWFLLNAAVLASLAAISSKVAGVVTIISVTLSLLTFIAIVSYHLRKTNIGNVVFEKVKERFLRKSVDPVQRESADIVKQKRAVTQSSVDVFRESLLFSSSYESVSSPPLTI